MRESPDLISLQTLDSLAGNGPLKDVDEPLNNSQGETSRLGVERDRSKTKRHKVLHKLGLR
jgi:hypothetical protein